MRLFLASGILLLSAASIAKAQSGQPAPMPPFRAADPRVATVLAAIGRTRTPLQAVISPDGATVAWAAHTGSGTEIHLTDITPTGAVDDTRERTISAGNGCPSMYPAWSPDSESLAFLGACSGGGEQIYLWNKKMAAVRPLTHLTGAIQIPMWSPDGKTIAFLFVENATRDAGALAPMKPWSGVYGEDGVEVQRVAEVDLASGGFRYITDSKLHVYEYSWSPDSHSIAFIAAAPPGENNWWVAQLYTQKVGGDPVEEAAARTTVCNGKDHCGAASDVAGPTSILDPQKTSGPLHGMQIAVPRFSPDGKQIAFIGGLMSDEASNGGDIYLVEEKAGAQPVDITPSRHGSPAYFAWLDDRTLKVSERSNGSSRIFDYDVKTRAESNAVTLPESIQADAFVFSFSLARSGSIALIRSSFDHPPEAWAGLTGSLQQITHLNDGLKPLWGRSESIEWTNDGQHVQGWLLYPAGYDSTKHYPLIVYVHGGPSNATTPRWPSVAYGGAPFAALGYFVFFPNPRGSFGQGEKFVQANVRDFGYGDLRDILSGLDAVEKRAPVDRSREGLTGWSYGGFMTMFGVTQTTRFRAAVAGAGISNYQSYYGENSIDQWLIPFFGKSVYDDPAIYARSSAINFIKNEKTPTLVVVGDRDGECPAPQSFEFWHALHDLGVKTQLVIYPNEGHSFEQLGHRQDVLERALDWFETEMPAQR